MSHSIEDLVIVEGSQSDKPGARQARVVGHRPSAHGEQRATAKRVWSEVWENGAPAHIPAATVALDLRLYSHAKCGGCGKRKLSCKPQHKGNHYRILATCRECNAVHVF